MSTGEPLLEPHQPPVRNGQISRRRSLWVRVAGGGPAGNERLTATTAVVLLVLLAVIGLTLLLLSRLLSVHLFVGMLLVPPVALKMGSTGYRFIRYYTNDSHYRRRGPPPQLLRWSAPILVLSTVLVLASGTALLLVGPSSRGLLLPIHKLSFFVWAAFFAIHVLGHLLDIPRALGARQTLELTGAAHGAGRWGRALSLAGALVAGLVLALVLLPDIHVWLAHP